ncbi:MAG TPA: hypothetical protein VMT00_08015 [Thermoanaerobaculia bacterium]|nr:hypothetical protein [Thermoanaerobaculia bacterium]
MISGSDYSTLSFPQAWARIGGALYLIIIIVGFLGEVFVRGVKGVDMERWRLRAQEAKRMTAAINESTPLVESNP